MHILVTNDDGIRAPGIGALVEALREVAEVAVVAPETERSAVGHAITLSEPLRVTEDRRFGVPGWAVSGTPADCVKIGVRALLPRPPELVLSGINQGANVGTNVLYSGTVSAATEAVMLGIPAAALSLADRHFSDFSPAAAVARRLSRRLLERPLPPGIALNVNVPPLPTDEIKGTVLTRQGRLRVEEWFDRRVDPRNNVYYWMAGEHLADESKEGVEFDDAALNAGYVSVTPINFDLTAREAVSLLREWEL